MNFVLHPDRFDLNRAISHTYTSHVFVAIIMHGKMSNDGREDFGFVMAFKFYWKMCISLTVINYNGASEAREKVGFYYV